MMDFLCPLIVSLLILVGVIQGLGVAEAVVLLSGAIKPLGWNQPTATDNNIVFLANNNHNPPAEARVPGCLLGQGRCGNGGQEARQRHR